MLVSIIVAMTENNVIGKDGKMPWRLPAEAAYFKSTTLGHPVITGRKNFEATGRALPDRLNVVVTRQLDYKPPFAADNVVVTHSLDAALQLPQVKSQEEVFIIGGQQIYEQAMPLVDKLYLTIIHTQLEGDTFFNFQPDEWRLVWSKDHPADADNKYSFTLNQFVRK